jgi:hypothetical protein
MIFDQHVFDKKSQSVVTAFLRKNVSVVLEYIN